MKRFWTDAAAAEAESEAGAGADSSGGHVILLDGKPLRLPEHGPLCVPSAPLARAIAEEWRQAGGSKGGDFTQDDTPLTRLAGTAQTRIVPDPGPTIEAIARYGETDLLCYRAAGPAALVHRQARAWQPWLDWAALTYDAPLKVTTGVVHVEQSRQSLSALRAAVAAFDPWALGGLGILVPELGSLVLGLAVAAGRLDPGQAYELSALDELFQAELWGEDAAAAQRRDALAADIAIAARFIGLVVGGAAA